MDKVVCPSCGESFTPNKETIKDHAPVGDSPVDLAALWRFHLRRAPNRMEEPEDLAKAFDEMLVHGLTAEKIKAEIMDKKRRRTETIWQFEERLIGHGPRNNLRPVSRVESAPGFAEAVRRKTIVVGETPKPADQNNNAKRPS